METATKIVNGSRVIELPGLRPFYRDLEGEHACVDATIAPIIRALNDLGLMTWVSCSGLPEDHPSKKFPCRPSQAYIGFSVSLPAKFRSALLAAGFTIMKMFGSRNDTAYMGFENSEVDGLGHILTADQCRDNWKTLASLLALLKVSSA